MLVSYNFAEATRVALTGARHEALRFGHPYVGTEHILLGLIATPDGATQAILSPAQRLRIRKDIVQTIGGGVVDSRADGDLPYTSRAKRVLELAMREAFELKHDAVGPEHLLLGLVREEHGIAAAALMEAGLRLEAVRVIVAKRHGGESAQRQSGFRRLWIWVADRFGMLPRG